MSSSFTRRSITVLSLLGILRARMTMAAEQNGVIASNQGPVELNHGETRVALAPRGDAAAALQRLASLQPGQQVIVVLRDIHTAAQPGVVYRLYFGLPPGVAAATSDAQPIGLLNFFAFGPPNPRRDMSRSYDVTETIQQLSTKNLSLERIAVTFAVDGGGSPAANSHAMIGGIDLIIQ